jgi:DNA repair exonuclease SbcCD ATPase subunit
MRTIDDLKSEIEAVKSEIDSKQSEIRNFTLDESEYEDGYIESLNCNGPIEVCGLTFDASRIIKELDECAYNEGFSNYLDCVDVTDDKDYQELESELEELENSLEDLENELNELESLESEEE